MRPWHNPGYIFTDPANPASIQLVLKYFEIFRLQNISKNISNPLSKYFENIFEIFRNLKYFEIYFEIFRKILHMRNLSKDFAVTQDLSKDFVYLFC